MMVCCGKDEEKKRGNSRKHEHRMNSGLERRSAGGATYNAVVRWWKVAPMCMWDAGRCLI